MRVPWRIAASPSGFALPAAARGESVELLGDFSEWQAIAMHRNAEGFAVEVKLIRGRSHRFKYIIKWFDVAKRVDPRRLRA